MPLKKVPCGYKATKNSKVKSRKDALKQVAAIKSKQKTSKVLMADDYYTAVRKKKILAEHNLEGCNKPQEDTQPP